MPPDMLHYCQPPGAMSVGAPSGMDYRFQLPPLCLAHAVLAAVYFKQWKRCERTYKKVSPPPASSIILCMPLVLDDYDSTYRQHLMCMHSQPSPNRDITL